MITTKAVAFVARTMNLDGVLLTSVTVFLYGVEARSVYQPDSTG
jgi:hypothetical protein